MSYLCCRKTEEHFPCTFGIKIPVNFGLVLKISSWWFHPSVVIIFADYAPHDNCICLWISHRMQMLMWPIAFLSCLYYGPCVKPCVCCTAPCPPRGASGGGASPAAGSQAGGTCCSAPLPAHPGTCGIRAV